MTILVTNDDGWGSKGLMTLLPHLLPLGHVTVVVPDGPRSGMSNAITVAQPITLRKINSQLSTLNSPSLDVYITNGTPSDCVKLAINVLFKGDASKIDLVVSGINHGSNAGINLIYSGTMGACFVAGEHGIPAIGFSIDDLDAAADFSFMEPYLDTILSNALNAQRSTLNAILNVNAPKGPIQGIRWTRQGRAHWEKEMKPFTMENGETAYTLSGYMVNDEPNAEDTDNYALEHGFLSIQPCTIDMTLYAALR
ncbi:MAG: 5'/3'-nucleotidase SurE [Paludibacteraceae bacterium]|nr:5'/3'-nucleotidase SurE [Paludibacteraceae bacterium]